MKISELGIRKLVMSAKGTLALLIFAGCLAANLTGHIDGASLKDIVQWVVSLFLAAHAATDIVNNVVTNLKDRFLPPKGQV